MALLFTDDRMIAHRPPKDHPERPERLATILRELDRNGLRAACTSIAPRPATDEELLRVHPPSMLSSYREVESRGGGQVEADTWISPGSDLAARLAAGSAIDAVQAVIEGADPRALCLVRPPGHHARPDAPMGFCLYASIAVAAKDAIGRLGLQRVLIVDWDVHHGNGTQEIFYNDPRVGFLSIHRYPFYPGSGAADETGTGAGLGATRNIPLPFGTPRSRFLSAFRSALGDMADRTRPELILLSAGFDAHAEDPVGNLGLESEDFATMTRDVLNVANTHCQGRIVSVLEGGYNVDRLAESVSAHLETLLDRQNEPRS